MFNIVLYQPEIPPNTGNIMRLCANTGCSLHLIEPLGFNLTDKHLKRANLDYEMLRTVKRYPDFDAYRGAFPESTFYLCSTKGATQYTKIAFKPYDSFVFGPETRGLPQTLLEKYPAQQKIFIPMQTHSRSLNLANAAAVIVYEAWRQWDFVNLVNTVESDILLGHL